MRRTLLAAATLLLLAAPLAAYTIVLKDGSKLVAREKYTVAGDKAQIILPGGARTSLPLADIDVTATQQANASDYGNAIVVGEPTRSPSAAPTPKAPTLSDMAAMRQLPQLPPAAPAATQAPPQEAPRPSTAERNEGGSVDLMRLPRQPVAQSAAVSRLSDLLRAKGLQTVRLYQGTASGRVLLDVMANSEGAVFNALQIAASALLELEEPGGEAVAAIELIMVTERRQRAGQFMLTRERARELADKQIEVSAFFVKYVEF